MALLDTTFIIDLMKRVPEAMEKATELEKSSEVVRIPTPVIFELWEGIERSDHPLTEEKKVSRTLGSILEMPLSGEHAKVAGKKSGQLIRRGEMLDPIDLLIGGMASAENESLLTRDTDFDKIEDVDVEGY